MSVAEIPETKAARSVIWGLSLFVVLAVTLVIYGIPRGTFASEGPTFLATVNAALNASAGVSLLAGLWFVRRKDIRRHRAAMLTAFGFSSVFLVTYLAHHATRGSVPFQHEGWLKTLYLAILIPHILLAAAILPLALFTIYRGWTGRIELHRKVARITLPLWLYVSFSGVAVYLMLYHLP
jgi:putative membrane protein